MAREAKVAYLPFLAPIKRELEEVEKVMLEKISLTYQPLAENVTQLIRGGGKRLRPALAILASKFHPADRGKVILLAASIEMLHTATLIHDDLIDNASSRRGLPTLNSMWPSAAVVLAGDHILAGAASLAARTGSPRVVRIIAETLQIICDGEIRQIFGAYGWPQDIKDYYYRIYAKTASLFAAATEAGGVLSKAPEGEIQALRKYGEYLGTAFQIVDDVLDFTGKEEEMGKPTGSDLRQGIVTLPVFYFMEDYNDSKLLLKALNARGEERGEAIATLVELIRNSQAIKLSLDKAREFVIRAKEALSIFPDNQYRRIMLELADFVIERKI
ncbi:MAG TPA: polyprenyl synthetase family protein [Chloroflexi bacterium]|nr:polyprenyl synthetase family protein [Chloroflexota bacterium]